jgi:hypothetical protein
LEDQERGERITLKWIFRKKDGSMGGGWNWLRDCVQWWALILVVLKLHILLP